MREDTGLLIASPLEGLGYQTAGALQRLGRRMTGLLPELQAQSRLKPVPMPVFAYPWERDALSHWGETPPVSDSASLLLTPEPELSQNEAISAERWNRIQELVGRLLALRPLRVVTVLPWETPAEQIREAQSFGGRGTVLLMPALFGFRDRNLLDEALELADTDPSGLPEAGSDAPPTPLLSVGDAAAFVVAALDRPEVSGCVIWVPAQTESLADWVREFREAFKVPRVSFLRRLLSGGSNDLRTRVRLGGCSDPPEGARPVAEVFPSPLTPLSRSLREMAGHRTRDPSLELVFPPTRGL